MVILLKIMAVPVYGLFKDNFLLNNFRTFYRAGKDFKNTVAKPCDENMPRR